MGSSDEGNKFMTMENDEVNVLCLNYDSTYKRGQLLLPRSFCEDFGQHIGERVYLHMPSGDIWCGSYMNDSQCINRLEDMMDYYGVKPYYLVIVHYTGGPNFKLEIFNPYAVEIKYPVREIGGTQARSTRVRGINVPQCMVNISDLEKDKLLETLSYNAMTNNRASYDLLISKKHLDACTFNLVLNESVLSKIRLDEDMSWIELSFGEMKWKIKLTWMGGKVYFDKGWTLFAKEANLCIGDVCVLLRTVENHRFKVSIHERKSFSNYNTSGVEQGKSIMKFFKIMTPQSVQSESLEFPRLFSINYGHKLNNKVKLVMGDGIQYVVDFCDLNNTLLRPDGILQTYHIIENYVIFFDYIGKSTFYVSVFDPDCLDICNDISEKLYLKNANINLEEVNVFPSAEASAMVTEVKLFPSEVETEIAGQTMEEENGGDEDLKSFVVCLTASHVDQRGHGVYCARHLISIYQAWKNSALVKLVFKNEEWNVVVLRKKKTCRFGLGWNKFTGDNGFAQGQELKFFYRADYTFDVTVLP